MVEREVGDQAARIRDIAAGLGLLRAELGRVKMAARGAGEPPGPARASRGRAQPTMVLTTLASSRPASVR